MLPSDLVHSLHWRYAVKVFDDTRTLPPAVWEALAHSLVLAPSSNGLQPWHFIVVTDPAIKSALRAASWGQAQVTACSHYVILAARDVLTEADIDAHLQRTAEVQAVTLDSLAKLRASIIKDLVQGPRSRDIPGWAAQQVYLALGSLLTSAAVLGVDACPMEGIDPVAYDRILGLDGGPFRTRVACALGYRSAQDPRGQRAKVRFPQAQVLEHRA